MRDIGKSWLWAVALRDLPFILLLVTFISDPEMMKRLENNKDNMDYSVYGDKLSLISFFFILWFIGCIWFYFLANRKGITAADGTTITPDKDIMIEYFQEPENRRSNNITDADYMRMVTDKRDCQDIKQRAILKIGLNEDELHEIFSAKLEGFVFNNAYAKRKDDGKWISSIYQVSWIFLSSTQVYLYSYIFNMVEDIKIEKTDEFFYKDVTSFSTSTETETAKGFLGQVIEVESNKFVVVVPGEKLYMAINEVIDVDLIIQEMKQKLREKKQKL